MTTAETPDEPPDLTVRFRDRVLDLEPFLLGFPYSSFLAELEEGLLFYLERTRDGTWLRSLPLAPNGPVDLTRGRKLGDVDWSKRSLHLGRLHRSSNRLFVTSDERNDERLNVYSIDLDTGIVEQLTDADYTYSWDLSEDGRYLGHLARSGLEEPFDTCLRVRDLETATEREVICDEGGADRFTWSPVRFTPDNRAVIVKVQHDGQRNTVSLARIDLTVDDPELHFIHPPRATRYTLFVVEGWLSDDELLFTSGESGFRNLYRTGMESDSVRQLTSFEEDLRSVRLLETDPATVLGVFVRPTESELVLIDPQTGGVLARQVVPASVGILDAHGSQAITVRSSIESLWSAYRIRVERSPSGWVFLESPLAGIPADLESRIQHVVVERVRYPTFDRLEDGSPRMLHAFLLSPRKPPSRQEDQLVLIPAFYGGRNRFSTLSQILAAMGIATFSPAPRGSGGFGAEFAALNDGDLGGDEIVDIHYAARWLVENRGYRPHQIGLRGGSHGGYATMRALTFPPETNGRNVTFDYGFGWSHAGFSNILAFYGSSNIPDWVVREAGDPAKEGDKLLDRSPISHVDRLRAPLLLTHGSNDRRVPVEESRRFAERAALLGRPARLVEFPGQGHAIRGFENQVRFYQTLFSFLESVGSAQHE
ncbi:MAG: prolyl oligopeptidase family serine peptidase [Myxococcota bacterium]